MSQSPNLWGRIHTPGRWTCSLATSPGHRATFSLGVGRCVFWFEKQSIMEMSSNTNQNVAYARRRLQLFNKSSFWHCHHHLSILGPYVGVISMSVPANSQSFKYDKQPHGPLLSRLKSCALFKPTCLGLSQTESTRSLYRLWIDL